VMMGTIFGLALEAMDDEDPWIEVVGATPADKWRDWEAQGKKPYTLRINGISFGGPDSPFAMQFAILGGALSAIKAGGSVGQIVANAALASARAPLEMSMLKQVGDTLNSVFGLRAGSSESSWLNTKNWAKGTTANYASGLIPSSAFLKTIGRFMNGSPTDVFNDLTAKLLGDMPFARS